jgi:hypothetical protein
MALPGQSLIEERPGYKWCGIFLTSGLTAGAL